MNTSKHFYLIFFAVAGVVFLVLHSKSEGQAALATPEPAKPIPIPGPWPLKINIYPGQADQSGVGATTYFTATGRPYFQ